MAGPDRYVRCDFENVTVTDLDVYKISEKKMSIK